MAKKSATQSKELFEEKLVSAKPGSGRLFDVNYAEGTSPPVVCLGITFENEDARRQHYLKELKGKLEDATFRSLSGCPSGDLSDMLSISNPPYYTACLNPFLKQIIDAINTATKRPVAYSRKPFAVDVSEGKTDSLYKAHGYHTKVPHLAIVPSLLHYTDPGDVILDGFSGSGMTGVAAHFCNSPPDDYQSELNERWKKSGLGMPKWGQRTVVLNDLSPAATFITANYNTPFDVGSFAEKAKQLLDEVKTEIGWMYQTLHSDGRTPAQIEYTVWSEVYACEECSGKLVFLEEALDRDTKKVRETFPCPHCKVMLTKGRLDQLFESRFD
jgi:hypothetical protein